MLQATSSFLNRLNNHADVLPEPATCAGPPVIHLRREYYVISATTSGIVDDAVCQVIDLIVLIIIIACCYRMEFVLFLLNTVYLFLARTKVVPQKR